MKIHCTVFVGLLAMGSVLRAERPEATKENLLDFWDQAPRITVARPGADLAAEVAQREQEQYKNADVTLCFDRAKVGAFSIQVSHSGPVTLLSNLWLKSLPLPRGATLEFWLAVDAANPLPGSIPATIAASSGSKCELTAGVVKKETGWWCYQGLLPESAPADWTSLTLNFPDTLKGAIVFDGVVFRGKSQLVGVTDKPLDQWMKEAADSRPLRVRSAIEEGAGHAFGMPIRQWFDQLWCGQDVAATNAKLRDFCKKEVELCQQDKASLWDLPFTVTLIQTYYELGSKSTTHAVVLEPDTEKLLLQLLWERTKEKNDIGWASTSTWWLTASENHDLNAKVCNLITSRIFMNEPEYRDRLYPDAGLAPGRGYWDHQRYEVGYGPDAPASWKPTGRHNAADHYHAWVAFFARYITERAKRGFFLERASPLYMKWTLDFLYALHTYNGNAALTRKAGDFLTLIWADWAQEEIGGVRGGPKTRYQHSADADDSMSDMCPFLLGGPGAVVQIYSAMLLDNYALPPVVFDMALDSKGRGEYAIQSRGVGEAEDNRPFPAGVEKTIMIDRDARFLKYSWVTPDYILGTQMDHPDAVQSHLSPIGRWHGLIIAGSQHSRVVPTGGVIVGIGDKKETDMDMVFQTVQDKNVLIGQQMRRWTQINPPWYPAYPQYEKPVAIYLGRDWDEIKEQDGWVFLRKGNAYAGAREIIPMVGKVHHNVSMAYRESVDVPGNSNLTAISTENPPLSDDKQWLTLSNKFDPFIIYAGNKADYGSFESFRSTVLSARVELQKTVVPDFYIVNFQGKEPGAREIKFATNSPDVPMIGGKYLNYQPDALFAGPFVQSKFGSGKVSLSKGDRSLALDFNSSH